MNESWLVFLGICALVSISPGPAILYIITRTLDQGLASGLASIAGISTGGIVHVFAAAFGVAAAAAALPVSLLVLQLAGSAYLVWLGIQRIQSGSAAQSAAADGADSLWSAYRDGLVVNLTNPKTALFLLAFLPQFVDASAGNLSGQLLLRGLAFVAVAASTDLGFVLACLLLRRRLVEGATRRRWPGLLAGGVYIALGLLGIADGLRQTAIG